MLDVKLERADPVACPALSERSLLAELCAGRVLVVGGRARVVADGVMQQMDGLREHLPVRASAKLLADEWRLF